MINRIQMERKKGKMLMAVEIIKKENERLTGIPTVSRNDIAKWMKEDRSFIDELVGLCSYLDKREITKAVINQNRVADEDKYYLYSGMLAVWSDYLQEVLNYTADENIQKIMELHFDMPKICTFTRESCCSLLKACFSEYLKRIKEMQDEELYTLDILLEIADFNHSEDEFWDLYVQIIQGGSTY